jgi:predicted GH43/DUF377 family glycosyl hydrolase
MKPNLNGRKVIGVCCAWSLFCGAALAADPSPAVRAWLVPQKWERDFEEPILGLAASGEFDDTHIFAPFVVKENGRYLLWYCGSTGNAHDRAKVRVPDERVFKMGLATSRDGLHFERREQPVMEIKSPDRSILTPCILREADGTPIRENGKLRMWFTSSDFSGRTGGHALQEATSKDGETWSEPSEIQIPKAYAPSVLKTGDEYQIWYTDVTKRPWIIRHAKSKDGHSWDVTPEAVVTLDQPWEVGILVYPCVIKVDDCYLMWYGSYLDDDGQKTAIGFAASGDGIHWHKHPDNPVYSPREDRPWESNYVGNCTVIRESDGKLRMWYAGRKAPPFKNLYFALGSATWEGPKRVP